MQANEVRPPKYRSFAPLFSYPHFNRQPYSIKDGWDKYKMGATAGLEPATFLPILLQFPN